MYLIICLVIIIFTLIWYLAEPFYWKKKNIPYLLPLPIFGNLFPILEYGISEYFKQLNKKFPGHKYFGMHFLTRPVLYIKDAKIIQNILSKDFEHFTSHGFYSNQDRDPGGGNLFHLYGLQWKEVRGKLSQYFTPYKVKAMLGYVENTLPKLTEVLDKNIAEGKLCEMSLLLKNTTTEIITKAIFGTETDVFNNKDSLFSELASKMLKHKFTARLYLSVVSSWLYNQFKLTIFGTEFNVLISNVVQQNIDYRRKHNIQIQDFLQGMIEMLDTEKTDERRYFSDNTRVPNYNLDTVISQAIILHVGGVETSGLTMSFFLYEAALNPDIQDKCRSEVNSAVENNEPLSVKDLNKLPYLTAALQETLRMHSSFKMINRECTKEYKFPDSDLTIEPGTFVLMSPSTTQMDEENFPEPHVFRPERFLDQEKNTIKPGTYFPFGLGPRTCIGMSFAYGEMKLVIGRLLQRYEFHICSKTQVPIEYSKYIFFTTPAKGIWLELKPIKV